jgi:large subunit ribosomal protein L29
MTLPKYKQINDINIVSKIDEEIYLLKKTLFDLRMKKATNQGLKPHLFTHTKRRIAQLNFKKKKLLKNS